MCMTYTDVAQVANAARNYEILHERDDQDTERPDKRGVVIDTIRTLSRVVIGVTVRITTVTGATRVVATTPTAARTHAQNTLAVTTGWLLGLLWNTFERIRQVGEHYLDLAGIREQYVYSEKFTSTNEESIESYYHRFIQLINDLKRNKHFPENIALNIKFLNNLQPEWKRHVTIVRQIKNLHEADFTQIYDFLKMNQEEVNKLRAERLTKSHDPLVLMAHYQNSFNFPTTHKDQSSFNTHSQQSFPINNKYNPQLSLNQNFMQPPMTSLEDINDPTEAMNAALILFAKAFQLTPPTNNNQRTSSNPRIR
nr:hypothetical protein [Tanacetum cinerariifolium]